MNEHEPRAESNAVASPKMNGGTAVNGDETEWCDLLGSGSVMKKVLQKGDETTRPGLGSECVLDYVCRSFDDQTVLSEKTDFSITIGELDDVQGLDVVLSLMFLNEKALVKFDPKFAYGTTGNISDPKVEPNAVLVYEIHVKSIAAPCDIESLALSERKTRGNNKRVRGNWWFNRSDWQSAIQCYRKAIEYLDEKLANSDGDSDESTPNNSKRENELSAVAAMDKELHEILKDRIKVYCNMALAQYKVGSEDNALYSFDMVLRCQPDNLKALFWKAKILGNKNEIEEAVKLLQVACKKAESQNVSSVAIRNELKRLLQLKEKNLNAERSLAKKMFRKLGNNMDETGFDVSNKNSSFWSKPKVMLMGSSAAVIISSICVYHYFFK